MISAETSSSKNRAVVFVTDAGYLVPSLCAALQVAQQRKVSELADVYILLIDFSENLISRLARDFGPSGLIFSRLDSTLFSINCGVHFNETHVPPSCLGRFALHYVIPANYDNIIYIDGDVQILGDISPLVRHQVKPGYICAATESVWLHHGELGDFWTKHDAYLQALGISDPESYFNSGVLAFRRSTWEEFGPKAFDFFLKNSTKCIYHDQSALNVVFNGRREILSPVYNFNTAFAQLGLGQDISPKIAHFTGGNKPWQFSGPPWNGVFIESYACLIRDYDYLSEFIATPKADRNDKTWRTGFAGSILRSVRRRRQRKRFLRYMTTASFSFA